MGDWEVYFVLLDCESSFGHSIQKSKNVIFEYFNSPREVIDYVNSIKPDFLVTEDKDLSELRLFLRIKKATKVKSAVYVQRLFGVHAIIDIFNLNCLPLRKKLLFKFSKLIPFVLLKSFYKQLLNQNDLILANSQITATLLHLLYGIEPTGLVYPPVNTEIFKPHEVEKRNQLLLYLGSHYGDTQEYLLREICELLKDKSFDVLVLGNKVVGDRLKQAFDVTNISGVSDEKLARIYSECAATICSQKWELFGYVPVESMACGTPVLAFDCMGPQETIIDGKTGWLAKNKQEFLAILSSVLENRSILLNRDFIRDHVEEIFSINASVKHLKKVLIKNK